jgi:hypothetical protein
LWCYCPRLGAVDERIVKDQLCALVRDLRLPPRLNLALQRLEVSLNPVHADRERVNEIESLGVLGQHRREQAWDNVSKFP